jgi:hypothetical protein
LKSKLQNQQTDATALSRHSQQRTGQLIQETYCTPSKTFYDHAPSIYLDTLLEAFPVTKDLTKSILAKLTEALSISEKFDVLFLSGTTEDKKKTLASYLNVSQRSDKSNDSRNLTLFYDPKKEPAELKQRLEDDEEELVDKLKAFFQKYPDILTQLGLNPAE